MPKKLIKKHKTTETRTTLPTRSITDLIGELEVLKKNRKTIETREKELRKDIEAILEVEGARDDKGSYRMIVGDKLACKQARTSINLDPEKAEALFKEMGIWEDVTETKQVINEELIAQAYQEGAISSEELESITNKKVTYAVVVSDYVEEEEMPLIIPN